MPRRESDRRAMGPVIAEMIMKRKAEALRIGNYEELLWYRYLHARTAYLLEGTGYEVFPAC